MILANLNTLFYVTVFFLGWFCGVRQGKLNKIDDIRRIEERRRRELTDAKMELERYNEDEFHCSQYDDSKRTRLDREQWERDVRVARERLSREIEKLENATVWMGHLLSEISK